RHERGHDGGGRAGRGAGHGRGGALLARLAGRAARPRRKGDRRTGHGPARGGRHRRLTFPFAYDEDAVRLVIASRNSHKLRELGGLLAAHSLVPMPYW